MAVEWFNKHAAQVLPVTYFFLGFGLFLGFGFFFGIGIVIPFIVHPSFHVRLSQCEFSCRFYGVTLISIISPPPPCSSTLLLVV